MCTVRLTEVYCPLLDPERDRERTARSSKVLLADMTKEPDAEVDDRVKLAKGGEIDTSPPEVDSKERPEDREVREGVTVTMLEGRSESE